ncbi:MAG: ABC transporter ATP-binding protein [Geodermatophilaceae bacterium]|nr:ABC transporter ATP-binding protein [Geodermatophilaceae bacterium]
MATESPDLDYEPATSTTPQTDVAISVRGLRKTYGDHEAVAGVDLDIARGEIFALLGPNGAGKTTTVEILEGYRRRDAGEVSVLGVDPAKADARWKSQIGIVLQGKGGDSELTVAETVRVQASYFADPRPVEEVVGLVGLTEKLKARASSLSGGQQRRLDVALGIVGRPRLLFLDEPTTGFDPEARRQFWELIRQLRALGTTMLLTTHYLDEAEALADRVGVIAAGRIVEVAVPAELGGRHLAPARVRWVEDGRQREETTATPTAVIQELSKHLGGEIPELSVLRPSLEDIYLQMIEEPA